jgi:hypothetical protein
VRLVFRPAAIRRRRHAFTVASFPVPAVLTAAQGTYTLTGQDATFVVTMPAAQGSYTLSGQAATFAIAMPAAVGSYSVTGQDATFAVVMPAAQGTYTLSGQSATFAVVMPAAQGSYILTGQNATFIAAGRITADVGSYALTGQDANFALVMPAGQGTYTLSGQSATFAVVMPAGTGSYVLTGQDATLTTQNPRVMANTGFYVLTGQVAILTVAGTTIGCSPRQMLAYNHLADLYRPTIVHQGNKAVPGPYTLVEANVPCRFEIKDSVDTAEAMGRTEGDQFISLDTLHFCEGSPVDDNFWVVNKSLRPDGTHSSLYGRWWVCRGQPQKFIRSARRQGGKVAIKASQEKNAPIDIED